ncbi:MAG: hypothetical protein JSS74_01200 [Actinobacteria bacterium]|nr:hypothetical protein [Actinomycetota bacterium]
MTNTTPPEGTTDPQDVDAPRIDTRHGEPPRPGRGALTAITIAAAIIGGGALVVAGGTSAVAALNQVTSGTGAASNGQSVAVTGVTTLRVDVGRGEASIRFADVSRAEMSVSGQGGGDWNMRRDGDVLRVQRPSGPFGWWFGSWFGAEPRMTLTLPRDLEGELTADLTLNAGSLSTEGRFDTLTATVNAGSLEIDGGATSVTTRISAGSATLNLEDTTTADLSMSAGDLTATITGTQPDLVRLDASAGSMDVTVPAGRYDLSRDTSAGALDAQIQTDPSSTHRIRSTLSAGSMTIREGS